MEGREGGRSAGSCLLLALRRSARVRQGAQVRASGEARRAQREQAALRRCSTHGVSEAWLTPSALALLQ
jgi:hypothetical protein